MNQRHELTAHIDGAPGRLITADLFDGEAFAIQVNGRDYIATGKEGTNVETGLDVLEFATEADARLWATADAAYIWMD